MCARGFPLQNDSIIISNNPKNWLIVGNNGKGLIKGNACRVISSDFNLKLTLRKRDVDCGRLPKLGKFIGQVS